MPAGAYISEALSLAAADLAWGIGIALLLGAVVLILSEALVESRLPGAEPEPEVEPAFDFKLCERPEASTKSERRAA